jgi:hypothetical protein
MIRISQATSAGLCNGCRSLYKRASVAGHSLGLWHDLQPRIILHCTHLTAEVDELV